MAQGMFRIVFDRYYTQLARITLFISIPCIEPHLFRISVLGATSLGVEVLVPVARIVSHYLAQQYTLDDSICAATSPLLKSNVSCDCR